MYGFMPVCMYVCMCVLCKYVFMFALMYGSLDVYKPACICCLCVRLGMCVCKLVYVHVCLHVCMYDCVRMVCMYV